MPFGNDHILREIDHRYCARAGNIDIQFAPIRLQFKCLGMRGKRNACNERERACIDHRNSAFAIPNEQSVPRGVEANIIGIIAERDRPNECQRFSRIDQTRAIAAVCDE